MEMKIVEMLWAVLQLCYGNNLYFEINASIIHAYVLQVT